MCGCIHVCISFEKQTKTYTHYRRRYIIIYDTFTTQAAAYRYCRTHPLSCPHSLTKRLANTHTYPSSNIRIMPRRNTSLPLGHQNSYPCCTHNNTMSAHTSILVLAHSVAITNTKFHILTLPAFYLTVRSLTLHHDSVLMRSV